MNWFIRFRKTVNTLSSRGFLKTNVSAKPVKLVGSTTLKVDKDNKRWDRENLSDIS